MLERNLLRLYENFHSKEARARAAAGHALPLVRMRVDFISSSPGLSNFSILLSLCVISKVLLTNFDSRVSSPLEPDWRK